MALILSESELPKPTNRNSTTSGRTRSNKASRRLTCSRTMSSSFSIPVSLTAADFTTTMLCAELVAVVLVEGRCLPTNMALPPVPMLLPAPPLRNASCVLPTMTLLGRILPAFVCCLLRNLGESGRRGRNAQISHSCGGARQMDSLTTDGLVRVGYVG